MKNALPYINVLLLALMNPVHADDEFAVDAADSLDFDNFHKSKPHEMKLYDSKSGQFIGQKNAKVVKVFEQQEHLNAANNNTTTDSTSSSPEAAVAIDTFDDAANKDSAPTHFEIRQRYSLNQSGVSTPADATNQLYQQMAKHCPKGWKKNNEWSVAVEDDFYLHYRFECLNKP